MPTINRAPMENMVDPFSPHIVKMLESAKEKKVFIPTTVIYDEIKQIGYKGSLRWAPTSGVTI